MPRVSAIAASCLAVGLVTSAQTTTFVGEPQISKRPLDVEVTPNGLVAVVRGHAPTTSATDGLTFVDTATGLTLTKSSCVLAAGQGGYFYTQFDYQPSDSLRVTNSRAILVGARDTDSNGSHDRTYIDVVAIDVSGQPPTATCLAHHEVGSTTPANQVAGWTNDVELTPDGAFAIVNSSNWIHVVNMATGGIAQSFNIGSSPWAGLCFAGDSVDSIAATDETAVVTTTRIGFESPPWSFTRTWVYLIDLTSTPPTIALEHELYTPGDLAEKSRDYWPHDVTITPNGSLAIVTANNATAMYDLSQHDFLARYVAPLGGTNYRRRYFSDIVDSVETTNEYFVTTATDEVSYQQGQTLKLSSYWIVDTFTIPPQLSLGDPEAMVPTKTWRMRDLMVTGIPPTYEGLPLWVDTPHDVAVDETEAVAVIRSNNFNLIVTGLDEPDPQDINLVKYFDLLGIANNYSAANTFVSDSVLIPPGFVKHVPEGQPGQGVFHYALTLGSEWKSVGTTTVPWAARVNVIDLKQSPPTVVHTFRVEDTSAAPHIYPADIHVGPGAREFTLRCNAIPNDSGVVGGRDFVRFALDAPLPNPPLMELARIGANGRVWAVDSLEVGRFNATSVGEYPAQSLGHVHVTRVQ